MSGPRPGPLPARIGYSRRQADLAAAAPDEVVVTYLPAAGGETTLTRLELHRRIVALAAWLERRGVGPGRWLVIGLSNSPLHLALALAGWHLGATVLPLNHRMPAPEVGGLLGLIDPAVVVADWAIDHPRLVSSETAEAAAVAPALSSPAERIPHPGKAVGSGGSTGRPKIIVDPSPWSARPGELIERYGPYTGVREGQVQLLAGPLYHNAPFSWAHYGLFERHTLVLMERFDAARALDAIARHRVQWAVLVPTTMLRMLREQRASPRPLASLEAIFHTAAACPPWVKDGWIELLGADRIHEGYGSTENIGSCVIRGDDWIAHRGSVGRPIGCTIEIRGPGGRPLPAGEVGEIFFRPDGSEPTFRYIGVDQPSAPDRFGSVGDLGHLDPDGYLYLADRRTDLIITGGSNVYPAEVETVLSEHPAVRDVAVVGIPDPDWGHRVHAVVEPLTADSPPSPADLVEWCRARLSPYKVPKSFEFMPRLPRDDAGKIRRSSLRARPDHPLG